MVMSGSVIKTVRQFRSLFDDSERKREAARRRRMSGDVDCPLRFPGDFRWMSVGKMDDGF